MSFGVAAGAQALASYLRLPASASWDVQTLGQAEGARLIVRYTLAAPPPAGLAGQYVGKFYADHSGAAAFQVMQQVAAALAQGEPPLAVPQPLFYEPQQRLLAQQQVAGIEYGALARRPDFHRYLELAGRALATLHGLPLAGAASGIEQHMRELMRPHPRDLAERLPYERARIGRILAALAERAKHAPSVAAPIHRDFHLRNLFYGQQRVWLIDWDLFAYGDPALDVGNFLVYLRTHLAAHVEPACDAFLAGYFAEQEIVGSRQLAVGSSITAASHALPPSKTGNINERIALYKAFTHLRLACKRFRLQAAHWRAQVDAMLGASEACLRSA